jgi:hypothetical protein
LKEERFTAGNCAELQFAFNLHGICLALRVWSAFRAIKKPLGSSKGRETTFEQLSKVVNQTLPMIWWMK